MGALYYQLKAIGLTDEQIAETIEAFRRVIREEIDEGGHNTPPVERRVKHGIKERLLRRLD